jgi:hypothetical protein
MPERPRPTLANLRLPLRAAARVAPAKNPRLVQQVMPLAAAAPAALPARPDPPASKAQVDRAPLAATAIKMRAALVQPARLAIWRARAANIASSFKCSACARLVHRSPNAATTLSARKLAAASPRDRAPEWAHASTIQATVAIRSMAEPIAVASANAPRPRLVLKASIGIARRACVIARSRRRECSCPLSIETRVLDPWSLDGQRALAIRTARSHAPLRRTRSFSSNREPPA